MTNIRSTDMLVIDDLFEMGSGYVLNFSDRTFAQFFAEELNVDIDDPTYAKYGTSKARRLRCFMQTVDRNTAVRTLNALWDYREAIRKRAGREDTIKNAHGQLLAVINRLDTGATTRSAPVPAFDRELFSQFLTELQDLSRLEPHPRGYAFESFLKRLFDKFGLEARDPFRLQGEQIDGSFPARDRDLPARRQMAERAVGHRSSSHVSWQGRAKGRLDARSLCKLQRLLGGRTNCVRPR
jgi:hypothetical protein